MDNKVKFKCYDIVWDTEDEDGNVCELGPEMTIELDDEDVKFAESLCEDALQELIVDELSEKSGWLVQSFSYVKHEPKKLAEDIIDDLKFDDFQDKTEYSNM